MCTLEINANEVKFKTNVRQKFSCFYFLMEHDKSCNETSGIMVIDSVPELFIFYEGNQDKQRNSISFTCYLTVIGYKRNYNKNVI